MLPMMQKLVKVGEDCNLTAKDCYTAMIGINAYVMKFIAKFYVL